MAAWDVNRQSRDLRHSLEVVVVSLLRISATAPKQVESWEIGRRRQATLSWLG